MRIVTEGQYRIGDEALSKLDGLDDRLVQAVERGSHEEFRRLFDQMLDLVRTQGKPVGADELVSSDVIIPPPDATLEEAAGHFVGEGIVSA